MKPHPVGIKRSVVHQERWKSLPARLPAALFTCRGWESSSWGGTVKWTSARIVAHDDALPTAER